MVYDLCFLLNVSVILLCLSQYYALQILETVIKTRWKILPRNQCEGQSNIHPKMMLQFIK